MSRFGEDSTKPILGSQGSEKIQRTQPWLSNGWVCWIFVDDPRDPTLGFQGSEKLRPNQPWVFKARKGSNRTNPGNSMFGEDSTDPTLDFEGSERVQCWHNPSFSRFGEDLTKPTLYTYLKFGEDPTNPNPGYSMFQIRPNRTILGFQGSERVRPYQP